MNIIYTILTILSLLFLLYLIIKIVTDNQFIIDRFNKGNQIVFGAKGKGKDLLFQYIIWKRSKKKNNINQLATIDYGYHTQKINLKDLDIKNDYENMINGNIKKSDKKEEFEGKDIYISDSGIYLPCQYDFILHKNYKSLPVFYAISRHLYNSNIHVNSQNLERVWKALREQADGYVWCRKSIKFIFNIFIICRFYENYESANSRLNSIDPRLANKYSKAEVDLYRAQHGIIKNLVLILPKSKIFYDTRHFEEVIFNGVKHEKNKRNHYIYQRKKEATKIQSFKEKIRSIKEHNQQIKIMKKIQKEYMKNLKLEKLKYKIKELEK